LPPLPPLLLPLVLGQQQRWRCCWVLLHSQHHWPGTPC
jgi:hypothetical protein